MLARVLQDLSEFCNRAFQLTKIKVLALKISGVDCDGDTTIKNATKLILNDIFNGGCRAEDECWYYYAENDPNTMKSRCKSTQADCVFMFLTVIVLAVTALLAFLRMKKGY